MIEHGAYFFTMILFYLQASTKSHGTFQSKSGDLEIFVKVNVHLSSRLFILHRCSLLSFSLLFASLYALLLVSHLQVIDSYQQFHKDDFCLLLELLFTPAFPADCYKKTQFRLLISTDTFVLQIT